ncbi:uncharacterized protein DDB_G0283697 [Leguminivora glycinivorella]|uniref:uncharacterized protein DDB_G0283697 n=1 Tax=Leguminivora glycinivorella TaxID=1035111 RepID=UPI00200ED685|nr:uncharacterized protein DDB_G0283697 [Leguminivora glycinivorella]
MGAGHSAEVEGGAYASDPPAHDRRKSYSRRRRHSVDSVASYSSQNHVDRIRTQNFSAASCQDEGDFGSIKTSLFRRSSSNLEYPHKRPESVTSNTSSTRSRLRELVERKSNQEEHKSAANTVGDIQYFENPTETLEFDKRRNSLESKKSQEERPKKRKLTKSKEKDKETCENKNKKHEKYQSKLAEYYKLPVQLPQDEFYQHLTRSKAAEELLQKRFSNSDTEFNGSYGRLCKHKEPEGSNLRRSRSLAVIREETFTDLQIQNHAKSKRSQLIPRARLFDKPCFKDRLPGRAKYQTKEEVLEGIYIDSTASCFGAINGQRESDSKVENTVRKSEKEDTVSRNESHHSRSISGSWPNLNDDLKPTNLSEDSIGHSRNPSEIDSLDSNYVRKHYNFEAHLKNYKDSSPDSERSVVTPDHNKPLYITDHETDQEDRDRSKNNTPKSFTNDSLSVTHSDKDKKELAELDHVNNPDSYDEISIKSKRSEAPKNPESEDINFQIKDTQRKEAETQSVVSENDGTISSPPDSITSYISISIASSTDKSHKLEYLANSLAEKIDEYCESQFKENASVASHTINSENNNTESDPIYTQVNKKKTFADIRRDSFLSNRSNIFNEIPKKSNNEVFVTNTYIESDSYSTKSNCTSSKNITTEPFVTTLIENQYYSLPDINIGKCLRKSERIDAQLRKEDQEDIPCENTYEIAQTHFREILSTKGNDNYGQLNKTNVINNPNLSNKTSIYLPDYREPQIIQSFTKLEDDLKSIITVDSSNADDKDPNFFRSDSHQNEREINEIEGTIRNNKLITKSESLKLTSNSIYRPEINIAKSFSHDNINKSAHEKKGRQGIRKHYSLRQREPTDDDIHRLPSPSTVERRVIRPCDSTVKSVTSVGAGNSTPLLSRVQSFKTSAESNIAIVPLSGHQTIVIDPPLTQDLKDSTVKPIPKLEAKTTQITANTEKLSRKESIKLPQENLNDKNKEGKSRNGLVDNSSYWIPKDPFITIKLNKVVKTTIPKLKKDNCEKISSVQYKFEKPPPRLIIKDSKQSKGKENVHFNKEIPNMTRPQILQVTDSKNKKQGDSTKLESKKKVMPENLEVGHTPNGEIRSDYKEEIREIKCDNTAKEKLNNAIRPTLNTRKNFIQSKIIGQSLLINHRKLKTTVEPNASLRPTKMLKWKLQLKVRKLL